MPTDQSNIGDIELSRLLAERGLERSPRTCLRWRRRGVLIPPEGADEDDRPIYAPAAIDRAIMYGRLLDTLGHERSVVVLWGGGADLPESVVVPALRTWQTERGKLVGDTSARLRDSGFEQELAKDLRRSWPSGAALLAKDAKRRQALGTVVETDYAFDGGSEPDDGSAPVWRERPPIGTTRADSMIESIEATMEGGDIAVDALRAYADRHGNPEDLYLVADVIEEEGGSASISEMIAMLDACENGAFPFGRLVEERDMVRSVMLEHLAEVAEDFPSLASTLRAVTSDPVISGQYISLAAVDGVTVEYRATEQQETTQDEIA
jgi:hypothetical protein